MLNLFRRGEGKGGPAAPDLPATAVATHLLPKFVKRLRAMDRPHLLDLGRLTGANIEFFARAGCRVRVEDVLSPSSDQATDAGGAPGGDPAAPPAPIPVVAETPAPVSRTGPALSRSGARPSRRIVLPPRTFPRGPAQIGGTAGAAARPGFGPGVPLGPDGRPLRCGLTTVFPFPDESFDAIVAWDVFNFYDPASARLAAAETHRVLRPGGLVFCYFHARRSEAPVVPARFRIADERRIACEPFDGRSMFRYVYQNRDIEKMFAGMKILELYFLKNATRETLMQKKDPAAAPPAPKPAPAGPKPRFTLE